MSDTGLIDNLIQSQLQDEWLTVWEVQAQLHLSYQATLRWIRMHVPPEYKSKRGYHRIVHIDGLKVGVEKSIVRPNEQPKGYQGVPGRKPPNVHCRDWRGRFISHHPPSHPRPRPARKGIDTSRRRKYLVSDTPSGKVRDE